MKTHNMTMVNMDTDSISFCKSDMSVMTKEEQMSLLNELNSLMPDKIKFEHDGYFETFVVVRAKNYIMYDGKKLKVKGSAFKDVKKEKILKDLISEIVDCLVFDKVHEVPNIYKKYVKMAKDCKDISAWAKRATITKAILECKDYTENDIAAKRVRRNETEVWDAVKNIHIQEGDRVLLYPAVIEKTVEHVPVYKTNRKTKEKEWVSNKEVINYKYGLKLLNLYQNDADIEQLVKRVYDTVKIFKNVIDMEQIINYNLKKNKEIFDLL